MMEYLDVSSFKLVRVAAVDDDDLLHQVAVVTGERCLHLGNAQHLFYTAMPPGGSSETRIRRGGRGLPHSQRCT